MFFNADATSNLGTNGKTQPRIACAFKSQPEIKYKLKQIQPKFFF